MTRFISQHTNVEYADSTQTRSESVATVRDWGTVDSKGRKMGSVVRTYTIVNTEIDRAPGEYGSCCLVENLGLRFAFSSDSLRDGQRFGPGSFDTHFTTEAERDAAISKYWKGAEARARKTAKA